MFNYINVHSSLIGLVLSSLYTKSGHPSGLSICCSLNAVVSVLHDNINGADIPRSPGRVLDVLCICSVIIVNCSIYCCGQFGHFYNEYSLIEYTLNVSGKMSLDVH